jgi:hypothetical protein
MLAKIGMFVGKFCLKDLILKGFSEIALTSMLQCINLEATSHPEDSMVSLCLAHNVACHRDAL